MSRSISITVPYELLAISAAANMLSNIADELKKEELQVTGLGTCDYEPNRALTDADAKADLAGEPRPDNPSPEATEAQAKAVFGEPAPEPTTEVSDMDLDINGIPWDERIHASTKTKTVGGAWKNKRGVDKDLVLQITNELKESMGAIPEPETGAVNVPPAPAEATTVTPPAPPAAPAAASASVTTFAQLITAITAKDIDEIRVNAVLANVGVNSLPLLGARPDLVPAVAGHLGL
jgi:hypothetical protein